MVALQKSNASVRGVTDPSIVESRFECMECCIQALETYLDSGDLTNTNVLDTTTTLIKHSRHSLRMFLQAYGLELASLPNKIDQVNKNLAKIRAYNLRHRRQILRSGKYEQMTLLLKANIASQDLYMDAESFKELSRKISTTIQILSKMVEMATWYNYTTGLLKHPYIGSVRDLNNNIMTTSKNIRALTAQLGSVEDLMELCSGSRNTADPGGAIEAIEGIEVFGSLDPKRIASHASSVSLAHHQIRWNYIMQQRLAPEILECLIDVIEAIMLFQKRCTFNYNEIKRITTSVAEISDYQVRLWEENV